MNLKKEIIDFAKTIGIDLIGFTTAAPFEELRPILEERKAKGYLSGFEEQDMEKRIDPKKTMANAQSILVIGQPYYIDDLETTLGDSQFYGELARTAWGTDYHQIVKEKLEEIMSFIKEKEENVEYRTFVDTGPLVDRQVAYRAGLGWYGWNNTLISSKYGSWFFIGYLLINLEFPPDRPMDDQVCLACQLCIKHCPNQALQGPYSFNSQRCVSNLLQQKEEMKDADKKKIGKKIYGCDICQSVCPHNERVRKTKELRFQPQNPKHEIDLIHFLGISKKEFKDIYGQNASGWRGKKILQRNAIIAMGNHHNKEAIPHLLPLLKDPRLDIRSVTIWALNELDPEYTCQLLQEMMERENSEELQSMMNKYCNP
ncbi:domain of unknown function DUF1730 [Alkaliphilus metalliredigens QYMF]|uniref:4Fe-4S ferredoxin-type domain-containing protein n=1 Tax=Alkaliphilus metalliredigens (strain QYMF) TaxID=293826 RepID=A6TU90_ALKMQ|nr:tRNA epoxyqueuosine(34) reductase QueG [Alkaliphilus metalliredigens]ABR49758.1 domain of unknown function DUF1730 [Alkaliphilus metalliredigens QYMF]